MREYSLLKANDPELYSAVMDETARQRNKIELIASENFVSETVMEANGTTLTNKYAEGYPAKRYYGGCEHVDVVETIAIERAKELFGAGYANVQPHSGAQAKMAVFFALLEPGDTVLSMSLAHGGHLSHGSPVNMSGKYWNIVPYGVSESANVIDYEEVRRLALESKPKLILAGASAYPRLIDFKKFREIADEVGAYLLVESATAIAHQLKVPETIISLTIVALGTSLPELVTAITSLMKGHGALSLGNIIGANLFNLVFVSGVATVILPFDVPAGTTIGSTPLSFIVDIPVMLAVMLVMVVPALIRGKLSRAQGIALLAIYAAFCAVQFTVPLFL